MEETKASGHWRLKGETLKLTNSDLARVRRCLQLMGLSSIEDAYRLWLDQGDRAFMRTPGVGSKTLRSVISRFAELEEQDGGLEKS